MTPDELEQLIHRELQALPPPRAPHTLAGRVRVALEQRASLRWYQQSWAFWPGVARRAFLVLMAGVVVVMGVGFPRLIHGVETSAFFAEVGGRLDALAKTLQSIGWAVALAGRIVNSLPDLWLGGALAIFLALNATLLGLGAAAYRALYRQA